MKRLLAAGAIVIASIALAACGIASETETQKVVRVGDETVEIPSDTDANVFAVTRALMAKTAYRSWYQSCVVGQMERLLTLEEAEEIAKLPIDRRERETAPMLSRAIRNCLQPGRQLVDPNAAPEELAPIRTQTAQTVKSLVADAGLRVGQQDCVAAEIEGAPDGLIVRLANGSQSEQEELIIALLKPCR